MVYCIDSSAFITAFRNYYAFDLAPGFWKALASLGLNGLINCPIAVYHEIVNGRNNDELLEWMKENQKSIFNEPDSDVSLSYAIVADFVNSHYRDQHWIGHFLDGADPWVIAQAMAKKLVVVTLENKKITEELNENRFVGKIKIPNVCQQFGIDCINTFEFLRKEKISIG